MPRRTGALPALLPVLLLAATLGCGAPESGGAPSDTATSTPTSEGSGGPLLAYAECMRDEGVDVPDPDPDEPASLYDGVDRSTPAFEAADQACNHLLEGTVQDRKSQDPEQRQETNAELRQLAECLRNQGVEVPDPVLGQQGGPFGPEFDRTDPAVRAAMEKCQLRSSEEEG